MKILFLFLAVASLAHADWKTYQVKPSCGCWKTNISFFNQDEAVPFNVDKIVERDDTSLLVLATFKGESKMESAAGSYHLKSEGDSKSLLVLTFRLGGRLQAAKAYPFKESFFQGAVTAKFISDEAIAVSGQHLGYEYQSTKLPLSLISFETAEFLPEYRLKFFGSTDLSLSDFVLLPDGDLVVAGGYMGFGKDPFAIFIQPGGLTAIALLNHSADDDPSADLFVARINPSGEAKWAKEIWSRHNEAPKILLEAEKEIKLSFDPTHDQAVFEPRQQSRTLSGKGVYRATYSLDGNFLEASLAR